MSERPFWLHVGKRLVEAKSSWKRSCGERPRGCPTVSLRDMSMLPVGQVHELIQEAELSGCSVLVRSLS